MKQQNNKIIALTIIILLGVFFQKNYINEFPSYTHAWTQSDRYALALGFVNNDLDFFKPETFSLLKNSKQLDDWKFPTDNSITAVDFPLHDYIPSVVMKLSGSTSPFIFRLYVLLYSFLGLFFLFKLSFLWSENFFKSILILLFAATSPTFVYYQGGFLPTIPSLANSMIGIYFYSRYLLQQKNRDFNWCVLFLTLAALSRTTFAIPLIALLGVEFLMVLRRKNSLKPKLLPIVLSLSILVFYFLYNIFLRIKYGAIFLNIILPAQSFQDAIEILKAVKANWMTEYFTIPHYLIFALSFLFFLFLLISRRRKCGKELSLFLLFIGVIFIGCIAFSILMLRQFVAHDYYFLDTFYLPLILLLVAAVALIPIKNTMLNNGLSIIVILLFSIPILISAKNSQNERRVTGYWDKTTATTNNFKDAESFLDSIGVPKNAKMLVLDASTTNIPFILMNRKGYPIISTKKQNIEKSLEWNYDYLVVQNEFFLSDIYIVYPEIISKIKKIADNGRISICVLNDSMVNQTLYEFIGIKEESSVFEARMNFDTCVSGCWENTGSTAELSYSGTKSGVLTKDMPFGLTYKSKDMSVITEKSRTLLFSSYFLHDSIDECELVVSINENGHNVFYKTFNLKRLLKDKNNWEKVDLTFQLPHIKSEDYEFALFIWNTGKTELYIDDFEFKIF